MWWLLLACSTPTEGQSPGSREQVCDGLDDDADGFVDEGAVLAVPELSVQDFEGLTTQAVLDPGPQVVLDLLPGVQTVTIQSQDPDSSDTNVATFGFRYDPQGRLIGSWLERSPSALDGGRMVYYEQTVWGPHGPEHQESGFQQWSAEGVLQDETVSTLDTEYDGDGLVVAEHSESSSGTTVDTDYEYDAQGRLVLTTERNGSLCSQWRSDWDDLAYTRSDWVDQGCTGQWVEDRVVQYDALWFPLHEQDGDLTLEWDDSKLSGAFTTNDTLEFEYRDGRLVHTIATFLSDYAGEHWAAYNDEGVPYYLEAKDSQGYTTLTEYEFNSSGGLTLSFEWSEQDNSTTQVSYLSDNTFNISEVREGDQTRNEYSFDCHPPQ